MSQLKASSPKDATPSIVISFDAKWKTAILNSEISVVFRKRGPKSSELDWIYFYLCSPESAIIGRGKIERYEHLRLNHAVKLCKNAGLSAEELRDYAQGYESLAVFSLSSIQPANKAACLSDLAANFDFKPPQSFIIMSQAGKIKLDRNLDF